MFSDYIKESTRLIERGSSFVVALVVNYQAPISGKPGDRAIVSEDGHLWGWVAGGCSQSIIIEEALEVLRSGQPRMIRITPENEDSNDNIMTHKMTCHSGGTLDVYLEPVIPKPQVVILGNSAVAGKLEILARALDYQVLTKLDITKLNRPENTYMVVSTQGDGDERALKQAVSYQPAYLGFVASRKKAKVVIDLLAEEGIPDDHLQLIKSPAGLDINARSPQEIALSILAEIVMLARERKSDLTEEKLEKAVDPVCGMSVTIDTAKHIYQHQDENYYFCCEGCKDVFSKAPESFLGEVK